MNGVTKLTLPNRGFCQDVGLLGQAGMLDALQQLSMLQSLCCLEDDMQTLLVHSVPLSWPLLTKLQLGLSAGNSAGERSAPDWSLVVQQSPQLQALDTLKAVPLCLTALTSLTCNYWLPQDTDSFQCSRLGHLHVRGLASANLLPSTLTSLTLNYIGKFVYLRSPRSAPEKPAVTGAHLFHVPVGESFTDPMSCVRHSRCPEFCDVCQAHNSPRSLQHAARHRWQHGWAIFSSSSCLVSILAVPACSLAR